MTPIALFVYARPEHTEKTLRALLNNHRTDETELIVFCDGARTPEAEEQVHATRERVKSVLSERNPFASVEIIERNENWGLSRSIIEGIDSILSKKERVIVVEDDIETSPHFLPYHLNALDAYANQLDIFSISGFAPSPEYHPIPRDYPYDTYFGYRFAAWGWSIWQDRWQKVDFSVPQYSTFKDSLSKQLAFNRIGDDGTLMLFHQRECGLDTWDIQLSFHHFLNHALTLNPRYSLVKNIGLDGSGVHCGDDPRMRTDLSLAHHVRDYPDIIYVDERIMESTRALYARPVPSLIGKGAEDYWANLRTLKDTQRLMSAQTWLEAKDFHRVKSILDEHLKAVPGDPMAETLMGFLALELNQLKAASECFRSALSSHGDYEPALRGHIEAQQRLNPG